MGCSVMQQNKLVMMANQIAEFHRRKPLEEAARAVETHLERFWDPRMREAIRAHLGAGGEGLSAIARAAVERLRSGALP